MAMALLQQRIKGAPDEAEWLIESAGTWAEDGKPALSGVIAELAQRGIDVSTHRARTITREMLETHQLILTVDKDQREALCTEFPTLAKRIHLLTEMAGELGDVSDMEGESLAPFKEVADDIAELLGDGFEKIKRLAREKY